jgi:dTDP-glucose 4,6-dehydratase
LILITGVGGFVGSHMLQQVLDQTDWSVVALDSFRHNGAYDRVSAAIHPGRGPNAARGERTTVICHDLVAPLSPRQLETIGAPDYVVHIASRCSVPDSIEEPAQFVRNNIDSTLTVLELAREVWGWGWGGHGVEPSLRRYVHFSTDEVNGPGLVQTVTDHRPSSPYAASKAAQEDLCHAWVRTYGLPLTILNSANMFGERQSMLAFIPRLVRAIRTGAPVLIHEHRGRPGVRHYSYVGCVVQRLLRHLLDVPGGSLGPRLLLPGQVRLDNLALAHRVADLVGRPLLAKKVDVSGERPGYDPEYRSLNESSTQDGKDWGAVKFDDALERTVKWYVDHPEWLQ